MESELHIRPPKQEPWYFNIHEDMSKSKRIIDTMSHREIYQMYENKKFICDICGAEIPNLHLMPIEQHMIHLIDSTCHWVCERCEKEDFENNKVIAVDRL